MLSLVPRLLLGHLALYTRLLAGVYVSRALDMHLLLFHEMVQAESSAADNKFRHGDIVDKLGISPQPKPLRGITSPVERHCAGPSSSRPTGEEQDENKTEVGEGTRGGSNDPAEGNTDMKRPAVVGGGEAAASRSTLPAEGAAGTSSGGGYRGESSGPDGRSTSATTGKNGRFATSGRVREFRAVLKSVAAHASKMKVCAACPFVALK